MSRRTHRSGARSPRARGPIPYPGDPEGDAAGHRPQRLESILLEAPAAYRDVREVLEDEVDLVTPRVRVEPMVVLKG